jgi:hypothetical protein
MSSDAGLVRYMPGPPNRMDTQVASSTVSFLGIAVWPIRFLFDRWAGPLRLVGLHARELAERTTFETSGLLQC